MDGKDFRGPPPRLKKKRFDHTEKAKKRKEKRKKLTKADLRRQLRKHFLKALDHLEVANRVPSIDAKADHLRKAIFALDLCLLIRPGNHHLKVQRRICGEILRELDKTDGAARSGSIDIVLDPDWHG